MDRALFVLHGPEDKAAAIRTIQGAAVGSRVEVKAVKRTLPQNDLMWALLTEVSQQLDHGGRRYTPEEWKPIFLHGFGREITFLPTLDMKGFIPIELSSSDLSKDEMTQFIEFILKEGAERGVVFRQHQEQQSDEGAPSASSADAGAPPPASASTIPPREKELLVEFCRKGLATVGDNRILPGDRASLIDEMTTRYELELGSSWGDELRQLRRSLIAVLEKDRTAEQAIRWFCEVLECTAEDLSPRRAA